MTQPFDEAMQADALTVELLTMMAETLADPNPEEGHRGAAFLAKARPLLDAPDAPSGLTLLLSVIGTGGLLLRMLAQVRGVPLETVLTEMRETAVLSRLNLELDERPGED